MRRHAPHLPFIKKAVSRFMPGETLDDAVRAAIELHREGIGTVFTELGENVSDTAHAEGVTRHYVHALAKIGASGLDCHISVKLTQLGLDVDEATCLANLRSLVAYAKARNAFVWIDMEQHSYVDVTLRTYRRVLSEFPNVGVCLQAYLYRTGNDLRSLLPLGGGVRLVKGAYREPATVAFPKKRDVDDNFLALAKLMMGPDARAAGFRSVFGTHDSRLITAIQRDMEATGQPRESVEFHLLFGIQRVEQSRLAREHYRVRVLISYGEHWFPWYMRRLAERPANVLFVAKSLLSH
ncbi:MAG TPA: proline dehydrogenase family protein [Vicinamibacterales bacterium]